RGYVLLIDYAATAASGVHGYREQRVVADVLDDPGSSDITAAVDFRVIASRAAAFGLEAAGPIPQRLALDALGFGSWTLAERGRQTEGLAGGRGLEAVRAWAGRSEASLLVDPSGLGALQWLLLKTQNCAWPDWVETAEAMSESDR
ncbi:MAG: SAM-dependent methyltransferase, partial [Actinobacteria bacterium]|nr:SAM-dependent methyltransferase [Actinomycetota bacterium]